MELLTVNPLVLFIVINHLDIVVMLAIIGIMFLSLLANNDLFYRSVCLEST